MYTQCAIILRNISHPSEQIARWKYVLRSQRHCGVKTRRLIVTTDQLNLRPDFLPVTQSNSSKSTVDYDLVFSCSSLFVDVRTVYAQEKSFEEFNEDLSDSYWFYFKIAS